MDVLLFFTSTDFVWGSSQAKSIYDRMNEVDKETFNCRMDDMDTENYYYNWWQGMKKYAFKDPALLAKSQTLPAHDTTPNQL